jgi:hypothetical protein
VRSNNRRRAIARIAVSPLCRICRSPPRGRGLFQEQPRFRVRLAISGSKVRVLARPLNKIKGLARDFEKWHQAARNEARRHQAPAVEQGQMRSFPLSKRQQFAR